MTQKSLNVRRNQTILLAIFGVVVLAAAYFHSLNLNVVKRVHLYTDGEEALYMVYQKKPLLPKELNTYLTKVDLEKKKVSRAIYKRTLYTAGFVKENLIWLFHKNSLSAFKYVPSKKSPLFPPKFDYSRFISQEKMALDPLFVIYGYGTLQEQPYLFGSLSPDSFSIFKLDSLKTVPLNLVVKSDPKIRKFQVLSTKNEIYLFWQKLKNPKKIFYVKFDGKTISSAETLEFSSEIQHFFPYEKKNSIFLVYNFIADLSTLYCKEQKEEKWSKEPKKILLKGKLSFPYAYSFSLCSIKEMYYLAIGTTGSPKLYLSKELEKDWEFFKEDPKKKKSTNPIME